MEGSSPLTLFTGQFATSYLDLDAMAKAAAEWGYDGLELACGAHFNVTAASAENGEVYCEGVRATLAKHGLGVWAISNHLVGQALGDPIKDAALNGILPQEMQSKGIEAVHAWASEEMVRTARAAKNLGVGVVNGFTGSPDWYRLYPWPPRTEGEVEEGMAKCVRLWEPVLDEFERLEIAFALEVHPTEVAYSIYTAEAFLEAVNNHPAFWFNFDPSHFIPQGIDPVQFVKRLGRRIRHVHLKDSRLQLDGVASILGDHLPFDDPRRGWTFVSVGRGDVDFPAVLGALNQVGYTKKRWPLSVEWEDSAMDQAFGAREAARKVREWFYPPAGVSFEKSLTSAAGN